MKSELEKFFDKVNKSLKCFNFVFLAVLLVLTVIEIPYAYNYIYGPFEISESELEEIITNDEKPEQGEYYKDGLKFNFVLKNPEYIHYLVPSDGTSIGYGVWNGEFSTMALGGPKTILSYLNTGNKYVYIKNTVSTYSDILPIELIYAPEFKESVFEYEKEIRAEGTSGVESDVLTEENLSEYCIVPRPIADKLTDFFVVALSILWLCELGIIMYLLIVEKDIYKQFVFWRMSSLDIFKAEADSGMIEEDCFYTENYKLQRYFFIVRLSTKTMK